MFAPKVAKAQTITTETPTNKLAPQPSALGSRPCGCGIVEQAHRLQGSIGNQGMLRLIPQRGWSEIDNQLDDVPDLSRGFSKPPLLPTEDASRSEASLSRSGIIQPKLLVGGVDDPLEHEADRVAEQVMRTPDPELFVAAAPPQVSRKCAACEEKEAETLHTKPAAGPTSAGTEAPDIVHEVLRQPGQPLEPDLRAFMEPRFGADLSAVRVHTGDIAAESASRIGARAYTYGSQVVFGRDAYAPSTNSGRRLIAHELTHTLQQGAGHSSLQLARDFDIRGINPQAASSPSIVYFDLGSFNIPPSETPKITAMAAPPARTLTLNGYTSEEGNTAQNRVIIDARIEAVRTRLQAAGHTGPIIPNPQPAAGLGQLDYRSVRAVEIVPAGAVPSTPQCLVTAANPHPENEPCGSAFSSAQPIAKTKVTNAVAALAAGAATTTAHLATFFPGVPAPTIAARLTSLLSQLDVMAGPSGMQCHNTCDGACARPGYMSGQGATAVMTLCPAFLHSYPLDDRVEMLMHEGMHATSGAPVVDQAYRSQRLIGFLTGPQAETNTDSYINLILRLQPGISGPIPGGPPTDPRFGMTIAEESAAERALSFLEKWVEIAEWDTSQLYEAIKRNIARPGGWDPADEYHAETQHVIGWLLTLTDPGNVAPFLITPTHQDQVKVAGIHDRYDRMSGAVGFKSISMTKGAADAWAPNLGRSFVVMADFFALAPMEQVLRLIRIMAASMPEIPAALRSNYADAANQIRWHKTGIGP